MTRNGILRNTRNYRSSPTMLAEGFPMTTAELPYFEQDPRSRQLAREAERTLWFALECDCQDPLLQELTLLCVEPEIGSHRLNVMLGAPVGFGPDSCDVAIARLNAMKGHLRSEIGRSVRRKRVPDLVFRILPATT